MRQSRRIQHPAGTPGVAGQAEIKGGKADIAVGMSLAEGISEVDHAALYRRE